MTAREYLYNIFHYEFPTPQPLWTYEDGLAGIVDKWGDLKQLPQVTVPKGQPFAHQETAQEKRARLFSTMEILPSIIDLKGRVLVSNVPYKVDKIANRIIGDKIRYAAIAHKFANPIMWYHIGLLHQMEAGGDFSRYLGNGQPLNKVTTIVPKGRGPFSSFESGAIDAIRYDKLDQIKDWSIGNTLYVLEGFNGYGYEKYKGINTPYLWSGSNQYTAGYYVADSVYSKTAVSQQVGIALIYKRILELI